MKKYLYFSGLLLIGILLGTFLYQSNEESTVYSYRDHTAMKNGSIVMGKESFILSNNEPISIMFAGDTLFDWSVRDAINEHGPDYPFQYVKDSVQQADLAILNLETAVTLEEEKDPVQLYNFKSDPIALEGVKNAGFDMVSLANNHAMDYQIDGFLDTLQYLEQYGIKHVGAGRNMEEAYKAQTIEIHGKRIKILGFSRFIPAVRWYENDGPVIASAYQQERVLETIAAEKKDADYVLVYMHWGVEKNNQPEAWQRQFAIEMIDSGADAIIGSHPHVLQGFEYYGDNPIAYSLGNFLFPDYVTGKTAQTGLLTVIIDGELLELHFEPFYIQGNQIIPLNEAEKENILAYLESISFDIEMENGFFRKK